MKIIKSRLRNMDFALSSVKDIKHVALVPEVEFALLKWIKSKSGSHAPGVLIGGLALSFYAKPRYTEDVDLLFIHKVDIPEVVEGFKVRREGAFQENKTHVEIETPSATSIGLPFSVARRVYETAKDYDGLRVASLEAMIVLKLFGSDTPKREHKDLGDIVSMLETNPQVSVSDFNEWKLSSNHLEKLSDCLKRAKS